MLQFAWWMSNDADKKIFSVQFINKEKPFFWLNYSNARFRIRPIVVVFNVMNNVNRERDSISVKRFNCVGNTLVVYWLLLFYLTSFVAKPQIYDTHTYICCNIINLSILTVKYMNNFSNMQHEENILGIPFNFSFDSAHTQSA